MLDSIVIMFKCTPGVVGRVNKDALDPASKFLLQRLLCQQVIAEDEAVVEQVVLGDAMRGVVGFFRIFKQDAGFKSRAVFLTNPGEFKFLFSGHQFTTSKL